MGWGRTLLLGDIGNRLDIDDVEREIADLRRQMASGADGSGPQDELIDQEAPVRQCRTEALFNGADSPVGQKWHRHAKRPAIHRCHGGRARRASGR